MDRNERPFSQSDIERIVNETFIQRVDYHAALPSSNDRALQLRGGDLERLPLLVLADRQTAGRGQGGNRWWSAAGSLTFTVLISAPTFGIGQSSYPLVGLATGVAVCRGCEQSLGSEALQLKWPNDVLAGRQKVSGILVESPAHRNDLLAIGVGVNVNNSFAAAPAELHSIATSLSQLVDVPVSRIDVCIAILIELALALQMLADPPSSLIDSWRQRCALTGREVEIDVAGRLVSGQCCGIDNQGALLVDTPSGTEKCLSGVVRSWG